MFNISLIINKNLFYRPLRIILLLIIFFIPVASYGQLWSGSDYTLHLLDDSSYKHFICIEEDYLAHSNSLTNSFIDEVFSGEMLKQESKENAMDRLKVINRFGYYNLIM